MTRLLGRRIRMTGAIMKCGNGHAPDRTLAETCARIASMDLNPEAMWAWAIQRSAPGFARDHYRIRATDPRALTRGEDRG